MHLSCGRGCVGSCSRTGVEAVMIAQADGNKATEGFEISQPGPALAFEPWPGKGMRGTGMKHTILFVPCSPVTPSGSASLISDPRLRYQLLNMTTVRRPLSSTARNEWPLCAVRPPSKANQRWQWRRENCTLRVGALTSTAFQICSAAATPVTAADPSAVSD